ncbi:variant erythrocyte surface antigen-1 family protein, partial [Babesia divergens]
HPCP